MKRFTATLTAIFMLFTALPTNVLAAAPSVTITGPSPASWLTSTIPTLTWSFTDPDGDSQQSYRITVKHNGTLIYDSQEVQSSAVSAGVPLSGDGSYEVSLTVKDEDGETATASQNLNVDRTAPTAPTLQVTGASNSQYVTLNITDGQDSGSGVQKSQYMINVNGSWIDYTTPVTLARAGTTVVYARTIDRAGNISSTATSTLENVQVNPNAPSIMLSNSDWTNQNVIVQISGGAGGRNEYKIGSSGTWTTYSSPIQISTEGQTEVFARTFSTTGEEGPSTSAIVKIDKTAPSQPTPWKSSSGWTIGSVTFTVTAGTDALSGVQKTQYRIGNGVWIDYVGPVNFTQNGTTTIYFRSIDRAGNISNLSDTTIYLYSDVHSIPDFSKMDAEFQVTQDAVHITFENQPRGYQIAIERDDEEITRTYDSLYKDSHIQRGKRYDYDIYVLNGEFRYRVESELVTIPYAKMDLSSSKHVVKVTGSSIHFALPTIEKVEKYRVTNQAGTVVYEGKEPSFTISKLKPNTLYTFDVVYYVGGITSEKATLAISTLGAGAGSQTNGSTNGSGSTTNQSGGTGGGVTSGVGFTDIENVFSKDAIIDLSNRGIITGVSADRFEPEKTISRAEFTALIVRMTGLKSSRPYDGKFKDVSPNDWFFPELQTAWEYQFIGGLSPTKFGPNEEITREQAAVIIYRLFRTNQTGPALTYRDANTIAEYARPAVQYLLQKGIVNGFEDNTFRPKKVLTRAEAAAIIHRFINVGG